MRTQPKENFSRRVASWVFLVALALVAVGCGDPASSGIGTVRIRMTDEPFPHRFIRAVRVTVADAGLRTITSGSYQSVQLAPRTFDLITLQNGATDTLSVHPLSVSSYDAIRLTFTQVEVELTDRRILTPLDAGTDSPVTVVVPARTPVKVQDNRLVDLVVDVDLPRSLRPLGSTASVGTITGFEFTPAARMVNLATAGQITGLARHDNGTVSDLSDDVPISGLQMGIVQTGTTDTVSVFTDDQGQFTAFFISAGVYTLIAPSTDSTATRTIGDVVVTTANPTRQDMLMPYP